VQSLQHQTRFYQDHSHLPHMPPRVFNFICHFVMLLDVTVKGLKSFQYSRYYRQLSQLGMHFCPVNQCNIRSVVVYCIYLFIYLQVDLINVHYIIFIPCY
jgi:hypothetical protein